MESEKKKERTRTFEIFEVMSHFEENVKVSLFLGEKLVRLLSGFVAMTIFENTSLHPQWRIFVQCLISRSETSGKKASMQFIC